jgi:hypothetical protein
MDLGLMDRLSWATENLTNDTGERLSPEERNYYREILFGETLAAIAQYGRMANEIEGYLTRGEDPAHVRVPVGVTAERLRLAARLVQSTSGAIAQAGGAGAVIEPGSLGRLATVLEPAAGRPRRLPGPDRSPSAPLPADAHGNTQYCEEPPTTGHRRCETGRGAKPGSSSNSRWPRHRSVATLVSRFHPWANASTLTVNRLDSERNPRIPLEGAVSVKRARAAGGEG